MGTADARLDALADDESELAFQILDDLAHDVWMLIEQKEKPQ